MDAQSTYVSADAAPSQHRHAQAAASALAALHCHSGLAEPGELTGARLACSHELGLAEVHLGVLAHELLQHLLLLGLLAGGQAHLLLALVPHHLLHRLPRLRIQIRQLGVLRLHLLRVDLGLALQDALPP